MQVLQTELEGVSCRYNIDIFDYLNCSLSTGPQRKLTVLGSFKTEADFILVSCLSYIYMVHHS